MRQVATWMVAVGLVTAFVGCGGDRAEDGTPVSAEQAVREMLDALAKGDAKPLCEAQDLREHYAALPEPVRASTPFDAFAQQFADSCSLRAAQAYVVGESEHQVVGQYEEAGRTVVKVRFRPNAATSWVEWDLPCRHIDGVWRMGTEAAAAVFGGRLRPPSAAPHAEDASPTSRHPPVAVAEVPPVAQPEPAAEPVAPALDEAEQEALSALRRFVAQGGDVNEILSESTLLRWPAMDVTRLHVAAERGWSLVAAHLVEQGANVEALASTKSHYNQVTPIDVARHAGHADLAAYLEQSRMRRPTAVRLLELTFPDPRNAAALVALDAGRIRLATEDLFGQEVDDDLFVEPSDPEIGALTKGFDALVHIGSDAAVALARGSFDELREVPTPTPRWGLQLPPASIRPGTSFLVRSGSGRIYKVEIQQCDTSRLALRYALLPAGQAPATTASDRSTAGARQAVRDTAREFVRASQRGDVQAAAALCVGQVARSLLEESGDGEHHPAISEYDVREVDVTGAQATATVWVRNDAFPEGQDEHTLKLTLRRIGADWRIDGVSLEPRWEPEDLGPEVDR